MGAPVHTEVPLRRALLGLALLALVSRVCGGSSSSTLLCPSGRFRLRDQCVQCHVTCSQCSGHELFQCTACGPDEDGVERFLLDGRCVSLCPRGHFSERSLWSCLPCGNDCQLCTDASICAKCEHGYRLQGGYCHRPVCITGQVLDPDTGECVGCEAGCSTCSTENRGICSRCSDGYFLYKCRRHCPQRFFAELERRTCAPCPAPCSDCSSNCCLSCLQGYYLNGVTCVKQCPPQTFGDTSGWRCEPCHSSCLSCRAPGPSDCELCQGSTAPVGGQCPGLSCSPGNYFDVRAGGCSVCDVTCSSCFGPTSLDCSSCRKGFFLDQDGRCVELCPSGTFSNPVLGLCESCSPNCELCEASSTHCVSCSPHGPTPLLHQGQCWSQCPDGYFESEQGVCETCEGPCETCEGPRCLSCSDGFFLEGPSCRLNCSERKFPSEDGTCQNCSPHCDVCSNHNTCLKCSFLYLMLDAECRASCPEGHFEDMEEGRCGPCHPTCASCSGPRGDDCETCASFLLHRGTCYRECPPGTYYHRAANECQECHQTCSSCRGPGPDQCSVCGRGLVLDPDSLLCGVRGAAHCPLGTYLQHDGFTCSSCSHTCLTCHQGPQLCSSCQAPRHLHNGSCVRVCPSGSYSSTQATDAHTLGFCLRCDPVCASCSGDSPKDCLTCSPGLLRLLHLCVSHCPTGYYQRESVCEQCHESCATCSGPGPESCAVCVRPLLEIQGTAVCVQRCPPRFYSSDNICKQCHISCKSCSDASPQDCLSCDEGNTLKNSVCFPRCEEGTYFSEQEVCEPCDASCRHCSGPGPESCVSCYDDAGLHALESSCAPCCSGSNRAGCCECDVSTALCIEAPVVRAGPDESADLSVASRAPPTFSPLLLLLVGVACGGVVLYRARSRRTLCWRRSYERLSDTNAAAAMPHGVPEPDSGDDVDVVYASRGGAVYRRYSFSYEPEM